MNENQTSANDVPETAVAAAPVAETKESKESDTFVQDVKTVLKKAKAFPTAQDIVNGLVEAKLDNGQLACTLMNRVRGVIKNGLVADELAALVKKFHYRVPRRSRKADSLGRAARRRLEKGLLVKDRNAETFHACLKTTKDVSDAEAKEIYNYRIKYLKNKEVGSWRKIATKFGLEYANGTTPLNIFLRVKRAMANAKKGKKAKTAK